MKRIILLICMIMSVVGAKADNEVKIMYSNSDKTNSTITTTVDSELNFTLEYNNYTWKSSELSISGATSDDDYNLKTTTQNNIFNTATIINSFSFKANKIGEYTITVKATYYHYYIIGGLKGITIENKITIKVSRKENTLAYSDKTINVNFGNATFDLSTAISTSNSNSAITYSCSQSNTNISGSTFTATKPGTYTINANQEISDIYEAASKEFTVEVHKYHTFMINDYKMSAPYDGTDGNTWVYNTLNLRYINSSSVASSNRDLLLGGLQSDNHAIVKFSDASNDVIESTHMLLNSNNKIISSNPIFNDADKFDYVVPGNASISFVNGNSQKVTYSRKDGIPEVDHYATICLPFSVPASSIPTGYTFEKLNSSTPKSTDSSTEFTLEFEKVTELVAGKPYIFTRDNTSSATLTFDVPASSATFVAQPDFSSPYFYGTYINLVEKDLHCETTSNPYNNGNENISLDELDDYFTNLKSENRVAFFLKQFGDQDEIRRAGTNVSMRPFRAFFRFAPSDFDLNSWDDALKSGAEAKIRIVHLDIDEDETGVTNVNTDKSDYVNVYTISGVLVGKHRLEADALEGLNKGIYVLSNGKKVLK